MTRLSLWDTIARAIGSTIAAGAEQADLGAREIDRLADAVVAVLEKVPAAGVSGWTVIQPGKGQAHDIGDTGRIDWIEAMAAGGRLEIARSILGAGFEFGFHAQRTPPRCTVKTGTLRAAIDSARLDFPS